MPLLFETNNRITPRPRCHDPPHLPRETSIHTHARDTLKCSAGSNSQTINGNPLLRIRGKINLTLPKFLLYQINSVIYPNRVKISIIITNNFIYAWIATKLNRMNPPIIINIKTAKKKKSFKFRKYETKSLLIKIHHQTRLSYVFFF